MTTLPSWVADAARLPLAFAQVREDPLLDLWVVERVGPRARVIMIASGGCTAALLAASGQVAQLHLADINPAQLALTRLKLRLLQTADTSERLALLGHAAMDPDERAARVGEELTALGLPATIFGPVERWSQLGPDDAGRYEEVFARLRARLAGVVDELDAVLNRTDLSAQERAAAPETPLGRALDAALDEVMALPNLVALFGEQATRNRVEAFARHFAHRTRHALATLPARTNPYLWQMYRGRFSDGVVYPWFTASAPPRLPEVVCTPADMVTVLRSAGGDHDFVHLSNILDWLSEDEARRTLELAAAALRPGGYVLIRQLNSTLDIPALGPAFAWDTGRAAELHARDRSFFYRALHLGRKQ